MSEPTVVNPSLDPPPSILLGVQSPGPESSQLSSANASYQNLRRVFSFWSSEVNATLGELEAVVKDLIAQDPTLESLTDDISLLREYSEEIIFFIGVLPEQMSDNEALAIETLRKEYEIISQIENSWLDTLEGILEVVNPSTSETCYGQLGAKLLQIVGRERVILEAIKTNVATLEAHYGHVSNIAHLKECGENLEVLRDERFLAPRITPIVNALMRVPLPQNDPTVITRAALLQILTRISESAPHQFFTCLLKEYTACGTRKIEALQFLKSIVDAVYVDRAYEPSLAASFITRTCEQVCMPKLLGALPRDFVKAMAMTVGQVLGDSYVSDLQEFYSRLEHLGQALCQDFAGTSQMQRLIQWARLPLKTETFDLTQHSLVCAGELLQVCENKGLGLHLTYQAENIVEVCFITPLGELPIFKGVLKPELLHKVEQRFALQPRMPENVFGMFDESDRLFSVGKDERGQDFPVYAEKPEHERIPGALALLLWQVVKTKNRDAGLIPNL